MNQPTPRILHTSRLDLVAATEAHVRAELEDPVDLAALLNATVEPGWPPGEYDRGAQEYFRDRLLEGGEEVVGWLGWYAVRRANGIAPSALVGGAGFLGPPDVDGIVEIGFSVMPQHRRFGYASEMVKELLGFAFADARVRNVVALTAPTNIASLGVLERCGLTYVSDGEEEGTLRFEIQRKSKI
jgi:RimJ/RimL family protein N-acetyltransferase